MENTTTTTNTENCTNSQSDNNNNNNVDNVDKNTSMNIIDNNSNNNPFIFHPNDWILISQGAEGRIWKIPSSFITRRWFIENHRTTSKMTPMNEDNNNDNHELMMIAKERFHKKYRHPILDDKLTKQRNKMEARILQKCKIKQVIDVPEVYHVDHKNAILYIEYINGITIRDYLHQIHKQQQQQQQNQQQSNIVLNDIAISIGEMINQLHYRLGIIHGDLTTSNMMIRYTSLQQSNKLKKQQLKPSANQQQQQHDDDSTLLEDINNHCNIIITLIDFGLAKNTTSAEERAVDLYVLERALHSTHPELMIENYNEDDDDNDLDHDDEHDEEVEHNNDNIDGKNNMNNNKKTFIPSMKNEGTTFWKSFLIGYTRIIPTTTTTTSTSTSTSLVEESYDQENDNNNNVVDDTNVVDDNNNNVMNHNKNKNHDDIIMNGNTTTMNDNDDNDDNKRSEKRIKKSKDNNKKIKNKKTSNDNLSGAIQATLNRFEQVRQRGRKRECFG